ncbi:hypothetical protein B4119_1614 [Parageobacillus caldoxylosilyticus]|uniref:Uncharacterized protein n=1 Tax=Saccharococcus caldoxylosilyticus TaxID=81408 RepID=A0A150LMY6_9BACL|nr:hypothetical protein B4119_1614 [Parageobacillus caldoxylosilyticus]
MEVSDFLERWHHKENEICRGDWMKSFVAEIPALRANLPD